jgi:predicted nuclease of predicted toxin-antitoxin system
VADARYRFLVDQNLPPAPVAWLQARGHDAEHVRNIGLREAEDEDIAAQALRTGAILLTKDSDFVDLSWRMSPAPQVVLVRLGNAPNSVLLPWLEERWADLVAALASAPQFVELV